MKRGDPISVGVVGTGWIGRRRAETCAAHPLVRELHLADAQEDVAREAAAATGADSFTTDYRDLLGRVDGVIVSTAPETTPYPVARDCLEAGVHVLLEKPMAFTLEEADELVTRARDRRRACSRGGPQTTHDIDLVLWWMEGTRPVRVYAQSVDGVMKARHGLPDCPWIVVTNEGGSAFTIGANWNLPLESPGFSGCTIEFVGTEGALFVDDSHRDVLLSTVGGGLTRPLSPMPGEQGGHV